MWGSTQKHLNTSQNTEGTQVQPSCISGACSKCLTPRGFQPQPRLSLGTEGCAQSTAWVPPLPSAQHSSLPAAGCLQSTPGLEAAPLCSCPPTLPALLCQTQGRVRMCPVCPSAAHTEWMHLFRQSRRFKCSLENQKNPSLSPLGTDLKLSPPSEPDEEYRVLPPCARLGDCCCFHCKFTAFPPCKAKRELSKVEENGKHFPFPAHFLPCFLFQSLKHKWCIRGTSACS